MRIRNLWLAASALALMMSAGSTAANATGTYIYTGRPIECGITAFSCNPALNRQGFTASFTFNPDFVQGGSDQTFFAFKFGVHTVTDWSITDGLRTLSSAHGDILNPNSEFTFNTNTIRTWDFAASDPSNSITFVSSAGLDSDTTFGASLYAHGKGTWTKGGGPDRGGTLAGVPEPATWTMMIGGFGLAGAALRRRARRFA